MKNKIRPYVFLLLCIISFIFFLDSIIFSIFKKEIDASVIKTEYMPESGKTYISLIYYRNGNKVIVNHIKKTKNVIRFLNSKRKIYYDPFWQYKYEFASNNFLAIHEVGTKLVFLISSVLFFFSYKGARQPPRHTTQNHDKRVPKLRDR